MVIAEGMFLFIKEWKECTQFETKVTLLQEEILFLIEI